MGVHDKPADPARVTCGNCLKEVPVSAAGVPESEAYFAHFCGLECYAEWKRRAQDKAGTPDKPSA